MRWTWPEVWADERGSWWRLVVTSALFACGVVFGMILFTGAWYGILKDVLKNEPVYVRDIILELGLWLKYGFGLVGLLMGIRLVHHKPVACVFTDGRPFNFGLAFQSGAVWALLIFLSLLLLTPTGWQHLVRRADEIPPAFWPVQLIVVLCTNALAITNLEVLFRGYLQTQVAAWVKRPWLAVCISTLVYTIIATIFGRISAAYISAFLIVGIVLGAACMRAGTLAPLVGMGTVQQSLAVLLYPDKHGANVTWSMVTSFALTLPIWFVWLLWATRKRT